MEQFILLEKTHFCAGNNRIIQTLSILRKNPVKIMFFYLKRISCKFLIIP